MFTRSTSISKEKPSSSLNLNSYEFFEAMSKDDENKVRNFLNDPNNKIWQLKDENNNTALHFSVQKNNYELSKFIIDQAKKGLGMSSGQKLANFINEKDKEGMTALHHAVSNGNIKMVKMLKEFGANFEAVTNTGKNIMHIASGSNQPSMLIYLLLYEAQDITSVDENGSTPLHWACYYNAFDSVNYLLSLNVDVDAQDKEQLTPLHLAVANNAINIVKLLLQKGANKNIQNKNKQLPIDIAKNQNYIAIENILTNKDYNPLCTLQMPFEYIKPSDAYKKLILLMIIIPEIIIILLVLPFLESLIYSLISVVSFGLCLFSYFILIVKEPGYQKNEQLLNNNNDEEKNPLKRLLNEDSDLRNYCPTCFVIKGYNITHCFICNKCVAGMSHHCFWLNKCIAKKNKVIYIFFIFCTFIYSFYSLFICLNLIFDTVSTPYKSFFLPDRIYLFIDRGYRVLGANLVTLFSGIVTFPLFFLFMIELFKGCGLIGKKKRDLELIEDNDNDNDSATLRVNKGNKKIELINQADQPLLDGGDNIIDNNEDEINTKIKIPKKDFPLIDADRESNV